MTEEFWWAGGINLMTRALLLGNGAGALKSLTSTCKGVVSLSNMASAGCFPQWQSLVTIHIIFSFDSIIFEERRRHFFHTVTKNSEEKLHLLFVQEYNEEAQAVFMGRPGRKFILCLRNYQVWHFPTVPSHCVFPLTPFHFCTLFSVPSPWHTLSISDQLRFCSWHQPNTDYWLFSWQRWWRH